LELNFKKSVFVQISDKSYIMRSTRNQEGSIETPSLRDDNEG